ncbi:MAG: DNA-directed RNA polymerase subunit omega [Lentisphaeria bacterium]|nr:DNA-directed RNA polymerase subunit omega [Lentisphaeria bacterium]
MNNDYLAGAKERIPDPQILSVVAAKRAKQLALGKARPMVKCDSKQILDVALLEIAEGLLTYEFVTPGTKSELSEADVNVTENSEQE